MAVGQTMERKDGAAKVTGKARFTDDLNFPGMRVALYLRSPIAHGRVTRIDTSRAKALPGVDGVFTFEDVPKIPFATAGHPFSLDPEARDVADRLLLTDTVRCEGDEIAVVVAEDTVTARRALSLIEVTWEPMEPLVRPEDAMATGARRIHSPGGNLLKSHVLSVDADVASVMAASDRVFEGIFETQAIVHCQLENHAAYAYMEPPDTVVIVTATQIPHIVRRVVGEALGIAEHRVRVIKPYVGGGFGNKQDVILEPMAAFLTLKLGGLPVCLKLEREEDMRNTRIRHPFKVSMRLGVKDDGTISAIDLKALSNTGAYASHGHSVAAAGAAKTHYLYPRAAYRCEARTVYTNMPAAGAMRGYGSFQMVFALECAVEDAARALGVDSVAFRIRNAARAGDKSRITGEPLLTCGLVACLEKGKALMDWDGKRAAWPETRTGPVRRGLGVACFSYGSGTYPACMEASGCRMSLETDGSVRLVSGCVEIGQGTDTVFAQMAAETLGVDAARIHVVSTQDTHMTPFDTGAYASRQTYVGGRAVMAAARTLKEKILTCAGLMTGRDPKTLTLSDGRIAPAGTPEKTVTTLREVALDACYHKERGGQITAEASVKTRENAHVFGCTFVDLTVDIPLLKVRINEIFNIHDSGVVVNPLTAEGQVHGGMAMAIGAALFEELVVDPHSGRVVNANLLDYKVPTIVDIPDLAAAFVETREPTHPYGSKSLGEPPVIAPAAAIRNAILDATGVAVNRLPMSPGHLYERFREAGILEGSSDV